MCRRRLNVWAQTLKPFRLERMLDGLQGLAHVLNVSDELGQQAFQPVKHLEYFNVLKGFQQRLNGLNGLNIGGGADI